MNRRVEKDLDRQEHEMEPIVLAIAAAAAGKTTEAVVAGVKAAARLVRKRFAEEPENAALLLAAEDDKSQLEKLAKMIDRACATDPEFHKQLIDALGQTLKITHTETQSVTFQNNFNYAAPQNVVQAETINGLRLK